MKKSELNDAVEKYKEETKSAIQTLYDSFDSGKKKDIESDRHLKKFFDRHCVKRDK